MSDSSGHPTAASPLLETKLYIPQRRSTAVPRPRLIQRLDEGTERNLTLVSAPAGFGKTTLLAEWLGGSAAGEQPAAWLSLDQGDNNLELFWAYVITALRAVRPEIGENALSSLRSPQPPPNEWVVTTLINGRGLSVADLGLPNPPRETAGTLIEQPLPAGGGARPRGRAARHHSRSPFRWHGNIRLVGG